MAVTMYAPSGWGGPVTGAPSGATYTPDSSGQIQAAVGDVASLSRVGFVAVLTLTSPAPIPLLISARNADGTTLAAAASSTKFGMTINPGTNELLVSQVANNSTIADVVLFDLGVPNYHADAANLTLAVGSRLVIGSGTVSVKTLVTNVYAADGLGNLGTADLVTAGGTLTLPTTAGVQNVTINGAALTPNQRLLAKMTMNIVETSTNNVTGQLTSVALG